MKNLNLGIILDKNGKMINHRSLIKVLCNPFLRVFGWQIATEVEDEVIGRAIVCRCPAVPLKFSFDYPLNNGEILLKKRRIV